MSFTDAHVGDLAAALVDDQLDADTRNTALLHLERCPGCRREVEAQRQLKRRLHSLAAPGLPSGLLERLGALSVAGHAVGQSAHAIDLVGPLPLGAHLGAHAVPARRLALLRNPQRGRRILVGAASLLLVGAGTAVAVGGDGQSAGPAAPTSATFSSSFQTPISGGSGEAGGSAMPLTDPAFGAMPASFRH